MDDQVTALLQRAADVGGEFVPPDVAALATRGRRRTLTRTTLAVAAVVVLVAGLGVGLHFAGGGSNGVAPVARPKIRTTTQAPPIPIRPLTHGHWRTLPAAPIDGRTGAAGVWTGTEMIVWGGGNTVNARLADGASYNPRARTWRVLPPSPLSARADPAYAWTGDALFVWGGSGKTDGALYDPQSRIWSRLPAAPVAQYEYAIAIALGDKVVLLTTPKGEHVETVHADEYDPATNEWSQLPDLDLPADHELFYPVALAAGSRLLFWSMWSHSIRASPTSGTIKSGVDAYVLDMGGRAWRPAPLSPEHGSDVGTPLWTGSRVLLLDQQRYCGACSGPGQLYFKGSAVDPTTGRRTAISQGPRSAIGSDFLWTGSVVLAVDNGTTVSGSSDDARPGDAALWDPQTNRWSRLPHAPFSSLGGVVVWTGRRVLIWGQLLANRHPATVTGIEYVPVRNR
jgi:hypothetical protein